MNLFELLRVVWPLHLSMETVLKISVRPWHTRSLLWNGAYTSFFWWQKPSKPHLLDRGCLLSQVIVPWPEAVDANGVALDFSSHSRQAAEHYVDRLELIRDCVRAGTQKMGSYWDWALRGGQCPIQLVNVTQVLMMKCERERLETMEFASWSLPSLEFYHTLNLLRLRFCSQAPG